ncbi:transmembrane protein 209 isoform X1 [Diabrotica undecimpunctata]|uniref:transmembrane protein 209 isoform X1 n=1 Tax=Diabrotica undecimpunctata TaxID=50387 RepID=UPI003B631B80
MNISSNCCRPLHRILHSNSSSILERSIVISKTKRSVKEDFLWFTINIVFLSAILYDLHTACYRYSNYIYFAECLLATVLSLNLFYYFIKMLRTSLPFCEPLIINEEQKKLLGVKDSDPHYRVVKTPTKSLTPQDSSTSTPLNITFKKSSISQFEPDSLNYSTSSPSWIYFKGTPDRSSSHFSSTSSPIFQASVNKSSFRDISSVEFISDEDALRKYLKEHKEIEKVNKLSCKKQNSSNLLSSFWSHPVTQTAKDVSEYLRKCQYQLSSQIIGKTPSSPNLKGDDKSTSPAQTSALEVWTRINVDSVALTQWNENLRMWISQTILERLVAEFDRINASLDKHGLSDVKVGTVGLDRLRKTAHTALVSQFIPSLPALLPFLEVTTNQEYLEMRIRDLAKGGCMSEFKWNGGGKYNGKEWDESLPTDCAVVMHLLASYLDTQLIPLPNMPDTKAFSGNHFIRVADKAPTLTSNSFYIQEVSEKPPHYRVIVGHQIYEMVKGYNNLFHSILFFIYQVNKIEHGMLGRINLGRAGVNILWVIDQ